MEPWGRGRPGPIGINLATQLRARLCTPFISLHPHSHVHSSLCTPVTPHTVTLLPMLSHPSPCTLNRWWCTSTTQGLTWRGGLCYSDGKMHVKAGETGEQDSAGAQGGTPCATTQPHRVPFPGGHKRGAAGAPAGRLPLEGAPLQPGEGAGAARPAPAGAFPRPQRAVAGAERPRRATQLREPVSPVPSASPARRGQDLTPRPFSHRCSLPLPEPWRGVRDEALSQLTGIPGCVFVHSSGFIGGNRTREGALEMARRTLALQGVGAQSG